MKRKVLTLILTGVLCISLLTACGASQDSTKSEETTTATESSEIETDTSTEELETKETNETEAESKPEETKPEPPKQTESAPHTHTWGNGTVQTQPTCTSEGTKVYKCTGCNETKSDKLSAFGHDWIEHTETIDVPEQGHTETTVTYKIVRTAHCTCGFEAHDAESAKEHLKGQSAIEGEGTHYYHWESEEKIPIREEVYIVDVPAGQTTVTTYTCNRCGATK